MASLILYALGDSSGFFFDSLYLIMAGRTMQNIAVACIGIAIGTMTLVGALLQCSSYLGVLAGMNLTPAPLSLFSFSSASNSLELFVDRSSVLMG